MRTPKIVKNWQKWVKYGDFGFSEGAVAGLGGLEKVRRENWYCLVEICGQKGVVDVVNEGGDAVVQQGLVLHLVDVPRLSPYVRRVLVEELYHKFVDAVYLALLKEFRVVIALHVL